MASAIFDVNRCLAPVDILKMDGTNFDDVRPSIISAVIILNILLNGTVIAVLFRYPQLREDHTTMFILSLTLSDLANGCTVMPISAALCSRFTPTVRDMPPFLPKLHAMCSVWFVITSLHSLCWVTVYKMVAITRPFRSEQILSRTRCYVVIIVTWVVGAIAGFATSTRVSYWDFDTCAYGLPSSSQDPTVARFLLIFILIFFGVCVPDTDVWRYCDYTTRHNSSSQTNRSTNSLHWRDPDRTEL